MDAETGTANEQLKAIGTIRITSGRLRYAEAGGIVEDPELLEKVSDFVSAASRMELATVEFGEIRATEGAYLVDLLTNGDPGESSATINALLEDFDRGRAALEENADRTAPRSASECGVGVVMLEVLKSTSALKQQGHPIQIITPENDAADVAAPEPRAIVAVAGGNQQKKPKKVAGEVRGIGRGDERGCTVRVGKGADFLVRGLALEDAWDALVRRAHITGVARWHEGMYLFEEESYELIDQGTFEL